MSHIPSTFFGRKLASAALAAALAGACVGASAQTPPAPGASPRVDAIRKAGVLRVGVVNNPPWLAQNTAGERVSPAGAAAAVPGAVWAGRAVAGLPLRRVLLQRLRQNGVPGWRPGVVLRYGQGAATPWQLTPYLYLSQARRPEIRREPGEASSPCCRPPWRTSDGASPGTRLCAPRAGGPPWRNGRRSTSWGVWT